MKPQLKYKSYYSDKQVSTPDFLLNQRVRSNLKSDCMRQIDYYVGVVSAMLPFVLKESFIEVACYGTRNNNERDKIQYLLNGEGCHAKAFSVDIAPKGNPDYELDFNNLPKEWDGKWDIVFSTSLDHALNPSDSFYEWLRTIKPGGLLVISVDQYDSETTETDCSSLSENDFIEFASTSNNLFSLLSRNDSEKLYVFRKKDSANVFVNYFMPDMTCLRYLMPLVVSGKQRGFTQRMFYHHTDKYSNPMSYTDLLNSLATQYGFELLRSGEIEKNPADITFMVEGQWWQYATGKKVSLTYMRDFNDLYSGYINFVDHVIFPSKFFAEHYGKVSEKNLYLGSPKYDVEIDRARTKEKYGLDGRWALFMFPRLRDMRKVPFDKIFDCLHECGLKVCVKTRGKDPVPDHLRGDRKYSDYQWWPHSTMELIRACDVVINTSSTTIKECVMLNRNVINFDVKPFRMHMRYLYGYPFVHELPLDIDKDTLKRAIRTKADSEYTEDFARARQNHLFEAKGTCDRIWAAIAN